MGVDLNCPRRVPSGFSPAYSNLNSELSVNVSSMKPTTSTSSVTRRTPSRIRSVCTTMSTALAIWLRMVLRRHIAGAHQDHVFDPGERVARGVGVHGGHRAVVAGVHRLEHVEGFGAANLANDDPVRTHPQRVAHERALIDLPAPLDIRRPRFERDDVILLELQFGRVLDGDDPFGVVDHTGERVEQGGLARAGAARHDDVQAAARRDLKCRGELGRQASRVNESGEVENRAGKLADGEARPFQGERRDDDVDAASIGQPGVEHGGRLRRWRGRPTRRCAARRA